MMRLRVVVGFWVGLGLACSALAVIALKAPMSKINASAKMVLIARITAVNPDNRVVEARVTDLAKGESPGPTVRVQIQEPAELLQHVKAGQDLVIFANARRGSSALAAVHVADTWLLAEQLPNTPAAWRTSKEHDLRQTYPGRTAGLARLVRAMKEGKPGILDEADEPVFAEGAREIARIDVKAPTLFASADINGDKRPDLVVGSAEGVTLLLGKDGGFQPTAEGWPVKVPSGSISAFGDLNGDGRADLLTLGKTGELMAMINGDWTPRILRRIGEAGEQEPLAMAVGDFGDDGKPQVLIVREDGITRHALDANDAASADFLRLTGEKFTLYDPQNKGLKNAAAVALDANGDGRKDYLMMADGGVGALLVNRGFGAFLAGVATPRALRGPNAAKLPFAIDSTTLWTSADLHGDGFEEILVLSNGILYELNNPPHKK